MTRNVMHLNVVNEDGYKYFCNIHSFMNVEYYCKTMEGVYDLMKEYEIDFVVKETEDQETIFWIHTFLPGIWVETYSEKCHNDFYNPVY